MKQDFRFDVIGVLFGLGTVHHEIEFVLAQAQVGPVGEYMERWARAVPSTGWPSEIGLALHLATTLLALLVIVLPRRRELLCLMAPVFFLSQLASPNRIASHSGLMAAALATIAILGAAEWLERLIRRGRLPAATDWYAWTLVGLRCVVSLTYLFALFYKLNPLWFSANSAAPGFLIHPLGPVLDLLGMTAQGPSVLAPLAIYGTLAIEAALPVLLWRPRLRLVACVAGLIFHLPMIVEGIADFPTLILALYPAFLSLEESRELIRRVRRRPTLLHIVLLVIFAALGAEIVRTAPKLDAKYGGALGLPELAFVTTDALTWATGILFVHVTFVLAAWARAPGTAPDEGLSESPSSSLGSRVAIAVVVLVCAGFVYINLARFLGLPAAGAMVMYSSIEADRGNHFLMPRVSLVDGYSFVSVVAFEPRGAEVREATELREFLRALARPGRDMRVNLNWIRYHMGRICRATPEVSVGLRLRTESGELLDFPNVCAEPAMLRALPLPVTSWCDPECDAEIQSWARGELRVRPPTLRQDPVSRDDDPRRVHRGAPAA